MIWGVDKMSPNISLSFPLSYYNLLLIIFITISSHSLTDICPHLSSNIVLANDLMASMSLNPMSIFSVFILLDHSAAFPAPRLPAALNVPLTFLPLLFRLILLYWGLKSWSPSRLIHQHFLLIYIHRYGMVPRPLLKLASALCWIKLSMLIKLTVFHFHLPAHQFTPQYYFKKVILSLLCS